MKEPFAVVNADDYYGRSAFKKIYDELSSASEDYCMVGFRLKNTLTETVPFQEAFVLQIMKP